MLIFKDMIDAMDYVSLNNIKDYTLELLDGKIYLYYEK